MEVKETPIKGLYILEPKVFEDDRGYFFESFNKKKLPDEIANMEWVQENESLSKKGVLRGLHLQTGAAAQAKLIRVVSGSIYDVAVDVRKDSKTYGEWFGIYIDESNKKQLLIPRGFAHGFVVLSESARFIYKCDNYYAPGFEGGILWNDAQLNIDWPIKKEDLIISDKDQKLPNLSSFSSDQKS